MPLPPSFTDLASALDVADQQHINVIGIVSDWMPPKKASNGNHMCTFSLLDQTIKDAYPNSRGITVRCFMTDLQKLPDIRGIGDVVLLRSLIMGTYNGQKIAFVRSITRTLVFRSIAIPTPAYEVAFLDKNKIPCSGTPQDVALLSLLEQKYVVDLKAAQTSTIQPFIEKEAKRVNLQPLNDRPPSPKRTKFSIDSVATGPRAMRKEYSFPGRKFRLVSQLGDKMYADIIGQVVKRFQPPEQPCFCDLFITDYTTNEQLYDFPAPGEESGAVRDGDIYGYSDVPKASWPGPYGCLVLKVNVKEPHSTFANANVDVGDFVFLQNVKCTIRDRNKLEGTMWQDIDWPGKIQIAKLTGSQASEVVSIQRRKAEYWSARKPVNVGTAIEGHEVSEPNVSKKKKKKKKQKANTSHGPDAMKSTGGDVNAFQKTTGRSELNRHVRCSHEDVRTASVKDILDPENLRHTAVSPGGSSFVVPFVNARYRAKVRVVDYEPKALEDFSVINSHDSDEASDNYSWVNEDSQRNGSRPYKWYFRLLLEDASYSKTNESAESHRIWVEVRHEHAQFLFGNDMEDPINLRNDKQQLNKLREKLFVLWGNLEENSGRELSNLSFECCIMEWGIEIDSVSASAKSPLERWKRVYSMFGATIL